MPDEIGTETSRSDAPSADDSLFGDAADDAAAAVADEQDADKEAEQDPEGSDDADGETGASETGTPEDLKVVVSIKGGRATIGVQQPSSDPHIESFDDHDLTGLAQEVLAVTERARARWEDEPKHPAHERPAPPARRRSPESAGGGAGFDRRGRSGPAAARDAEAVLSSVGRSRSAWDARPDARGGGRRNRGVPPPAGQCVPAFLRFTSGDAEMPFPERDVCALFAFHAGRRRDGLPGASVCAALFAFPAPRRRGREAG